MKCKLRLVEIYQGKNKEWKGWHNLLLQYGEGPADHKAIAGPIDPETSRQLAEAISNDEEQEDHFGLCPRCGEKTIKANGLHGVGGVECIHPGCGYWFCY